MKNALLLLPGGSPEVVSDGVTGLLCDHGYIPGVAKALVQLLAHWALRDGMGRAANGRLKKVFVYPVFKRNLEREFGTCRGERAGTLLS